MNLEEIKKFFEENKEDEAVKAYLDELSAISVDKVEGFLKTYEGKKLLQPILDRNFNKGLETWKTNNLEKLIDDEVKKRNPDQTPEQKKIAELEKLIEDEKSARMREALVNKALRVAKEKGLPDGIVDFFVGADEETDAELIKRYYDSLGKLGNRRVESIKAKVLDEVEGVRACVVIENDTMQEDADGRPPKSFETILLGGEPADIARKIFEAKPGGIQAYGSIVKDVNDSHGMVHKIGFTYAAVVPVHVKVYVKKTRDYPINGDDQIKEQVVKYIGGTYENELHGGVGMSENVIVSRCESRMFVVDGVKDVRVELSTDGTAFKNENVLIAFPQVAETDTSKIEVLELV